MTENKLIIALDVADIREAERLVKTLSPAVKMFKIGKELFTAAGPQAVQMVSAAGAKVFLDLKFHDIPNTVAAAVAAAARLGVFMMNVHALGGRDMMAAAVAAANEEAARQKIVPPVVLGVTVLTSMADEDLREVGIEKSIPSEVENLARLAKSAGLGGVVASGQEISLIRKAAGKDFVVVTPGVRPAWAAAGDQKRVTTPREAIAAGADYIVVGRPVTQDRDPRRAAERIGEECRG